MITIAGYTDLVRVGTGGLGDVYRATRLSTAGTVAVKVLRAVGDSSAAWHRTRRELTALVALAGHGNVIGVIEVVDTPFGPGLVMEYAPGGSVAQLLDRTEGSLTTGQVVLIARHTAAALVAAHDRGIVHRDLKPQNLLIDAYGQVKLCDFGISALARSTEFRRRTSALSMRYASPEDLDEAAELTSASDVYSLGATLLHLSHGAPPTLRQRLAPWRPPAVAHPDRGALDGVIAACLRPGPAERPSASEVLEELDLLDWTLADRCRALPVVTPPDLPDTVGVGWPEVGDGGSAAIDDETSAPTVLRPDRPVAAPSVPTSPGRRRRWPWMGAAIVAAAGAGAGSALSWPASVPPDLGGTPRSRPTIERTADVGITTVTSLVDSADDVTGTADAPRDARVVIVARPPGLADLDPATSIWPFGDVGSCLVQVNGLDELMPVDCGEPHDLQRFVVAELDHADVEQPLAVMRTNAATICREHFVEFVGVEPSASTLSIAVTRPSTATWTDGDRRFQCFVGAPGRRLVGDAAASEV